MRRPVLDVLGRIFQNVCTVGATEDSGEAGEEDAQHDLSAAVLGICFGR